jgi:hypothetical protein
VAPTANQKPRVGQPRVPGAPRRSKSTAPGARLAEPPAYCRKCKARLNVTCVGMGEPFCSRACAGFPAGPSQFERELLSAVAEAELVKV